jgi:hypothetical protein
LRARFLRAPNVLINGANSLFTNYEIDGMDNNENFLGGPKFPAPVGFAKDVTILTSNNSAEYGRTGNVVVNVTSKSGSCGFPCQSGAIYRLAIQRVGDGQAVGRSDWGSPASFSRRLRQSSIS